MTRRTVTVRLTIDEAEILDRAAGQMRDDWGERGDGQTWSEFEAYQGITRKESKDFRSATSKLFRAIRDAKAKATV
jgi:hypothetical protein